MNPFASLYALATGGSSPRARSAACRCSRDVKSFGGAAGTGALGIAGMRNAERLRWGASCGEFAELEGLAVGCGVFEERNLLVIRLNMFGPGGACVCVRDGGMGALEKRGR